MTTSNEALAIAEMVFYAATLIPALFCLIAHGKHGLIGWLYVVLMCILRLAGNGMEIHAIDTHKSSMAASIISGIGLSPLLMASLGLLHEANHSIQRTLPVLLSFPGTIATHFVIVGGIALAAASSKHEVLLKVGLIIFATGWMMVMGLVFLSYRAEAHHRRTADENKLLRAIIIAMPLIGVRIIYAIALAFSSSGLTGGSFAVKVILGTLPEFLIMINYVAAGIMTRRIASDRLDQKPQSEMTV